MTLALRKASVRRNGRTILDAVSLDVAPGECVVLIGANGAGKSTLLNCLSGEIAPDEGHAVLDGRAIAQYSPAALATRRVVLPQRTDMAFGFSVGAVARLGAEAGGAMPAEGEKIAAEALEAVGMAPAAERSITGLSGGEAQRVHLARVLAQLEAARARTGPTREERNYYFLLDEPTSSLDLKHQVETLNLASRLAATGVGVLLVLHDLNLAVMAATRLVAMSEGRVVANGPAEAIVTDALIESVYGVRMPVSTPPRGKTPYLLPQAATSKPNR